MMAMYGHSAPSVCEQENYVGTAVAEANKAKRVKEEEAAKAKKENEGGVEKKAVKMVLYSNEAHARPADPADEDEGITDSEEES